MPRRWSILVCLVMATGTLAGCFGGDDAPTAGPEDDVPPVAEATESSGAISGIVLTNQLEPVSKALVGLSAGGEITHETTADDAGRFAISDVAPGEYRLQVSSVCCKAQVRQVTVAAGEVTEVNLQMPVLGSDDLQTPYSTQRDWAGMISCGIAQVALCGIQGDFVEELEDPNDRFLTHFDVQRGLRSLVVGMEWKATGGTAGKSLLLLVEGPCSENGGCAETYARVTGESPIEVRIDNSAIEDEEARFENIETNWTMRFRVFPGEVTDVMYQQAFTIYYDSYYWEEAPEGVSSLPDG